ncbi:MAG: hypothetical protein KDC87_00565 [Planctomycetes bacterium]|nr:hypothetical protein [Planctomycetota bacterium]MCB9869230.1 hypothetical protein [Planctomycetota bacterium]MCB9889371.1 hypothetical protein [Planctomycetota bacterium]
MSATVLAYLGPGGALTLLGSAFALLAAIAMAFFGLVWYPVKRFLRWRRQAIPDQQPQAPAPIAPSTAARRPRQGAGT